MNLFNTNFHLFDDSNSISHNFNGFIEHRYDQNVFSILTKIYGASKISADELWQKDWDILCDFPIHEKRDKEFMHKASIKKQIKAFLP